ncbi:MAG: preprotein translocase subunit SecG [Kangiellaceae bacterium]|nr:preprotein translocase subunit SecG [Kangiellaceae bacterium]
MTQEILLIIFLIVAIALVGVILLQQGKGAGMGASFGSGASGTVFGAPGSGNALTKITTILAVIFFAIAIALGVMSNGASPEASKDIFDQAEEAAASVEETVPATDIPVATETKEVSDIPQAQPAKTEEKAEDKPADSTEEKKDDNGDK